MRHSITVLAWVKRNRINGPLFHYGKGAAVGFRFWNISRALYATSLSWGDRSKSTILLNSWQYVGVTYNFSSGSANLWMNGGAADEVRQM